MSVDPAWAVALVAVLGIIASFLAGSRDRKQQRELAREERFHDVRRLLYDEIAKGLERWRTFVHRTHPVHGPRPPPPDPHLDDDAAMALWARIQIAASEPTLDAVKAAGEAVRALATAAADYAKGEPDSSLGEKGSAMEETRTAAYAAINSAERTMRDELA